MNREVKEHESYGMMGISRGTFSKAVALFGSSIKHNNTITLKISPASLNRHLNKDWFHAERVPYIEVEMSETQFAEAITTLNYGDGVPVTVKYINGREIEECPFESKRELFQQEFEKQMLDLNKKLEQLTKDTEQILQDKKILNKSDKETILNQIQMLRQEVRSNIPFVSDMFAEQMDKTVNESKGEVEAFVLNKMNSLGLQKLKELQDVQENKIIEIGE